jgi:hypothetical protein
MFGKIFTQIFDSSLADNPQTRWVFMDLLVLADQNGVVDMTREAIARRTNVPIKIVRTAIKELEHPDPRSRSSEYDGMRLKRLDEHRDWGWVIVNYQKYRAIANAEAYREVNREKVQAIRDRAKSPLASPLQAEAKAEAYAGNEIHVITRNNKFKKPEQNELELYASKIGLPVLEIQKFYDYYESNGWRVGRNPMKSWQAAMRNWKNNIQIYGSKTSGRNPENPRNAGVCVAGPSIAEQVALKIQRQNEKHG